MTKITENEIELFTIELLEKQGFEYIYAPSIAPDSDTPMRESFEDVILKERLQNSLIAINPTLDFDLIEYAIKEIQRLQSTELLSDNEAFHKMLTEGITVDIQKDGDTRGEIVNLIDFDDVSNNDFIVSNQFTIVENGINKRPDLILFINGLPLVVIELKNPVDENATIGSAYKQIQTYKSVIPSLFTYNAFCIISDGLEARVGTISAGLTRFMAWKSSDGKSEASKLISQVETMITGMLNPITLLDLIRNFIVYEKSTKEDSKTGITTIETVKKLAAYHQYYAVNKAVERTTKASAVVRSYGERRGCFFML
jgi:type I restriction enzyme R subunit